MIIINTEKFYSRKEAAAILGMQPQTLAAWSCPSRGQRGPRFFKRGSVTKGGRTYYAERDLLAWMKPVEPTAGSAQ